MQVMGRGGTKRRDEMARVVPLFLWDEHVSGVLLPLLGREGWEKTPWPCNQNQEGVVVQREEAEKE